MPRLSGAGFRGYDAISFSIKPYLHSGFSGRAFNFFFFFECIENSVYHLSLETLQVCFYLELAYITE